MLVEDNGCNLRRRVRSSRETVLVSCMLPAIARVGNDVTEYAAMHYPRMICVTCFWKGSLKTVRSSSILWVSN